MSLTASLDLTELPRLRVRIEAALGNACARIVAAAAKEGAAEARRVHRYVDRTGKLTASIRGSLTAAILGVNGSAEGEIVADAKYASFVENGTRPHEIRPRNAAALHFIAKSGDEVFAAVVHHPGTRPLPFMGPAYLRAETVMEREAAVALDEIAQREST